MTAEELGLHFVISLGHLLAAAETSKGQLLSEEEIIETLDAAPCISMDKKAIEKLQEQQSLVDIDPENVVADWHRRRIEFVDSYWPQLVFYVFANEKSHGTCLELFNATHIDYAEQAADETLIQELRQRASRIEPLLSQAEWAELKAHSSYFVVRSEQYRSDDALSLSNKYLTLVGDLVRAGALAISLESSYVYHSLAAWQELLQLQQASPMAALLNGFVLMPIAQGDLIFSCGMHSLGQPDFVIERETLKQLGYTTALEQDNKAGQLFFSLAQYLLIECPAGKFHSGNTFAMSGSEPRLRVRIEPCRLFEESDIRFNPFGTWHLTQA